MSVNEAINKIINDLYGGNQRLFAKRVGVAPSIISNIIGGRLGKPSFDVLQKILLANDNINPDWLILGKGGMYRDKNSTLEVSEPSAEYNKQKDPDSKNEDLAKTVLEKLDKIEKRVEQIETVHIKKRTGV